MTKLTTLLIALTALSTPTISLAQNAEAVIKIDYPEMLNQGRRTNIRIPDLMGYRSLKADFHLHTIYSDGQVWPTIRVDEAWRNGLDIIAITEHIEYRPHTKELNGDHNTSYNIAAPHAQKQGITLIKAAELTHWDKSKGGHINALFITDANALERPEGSQTLQEGVDAATAQGAFLIWNHPGWPDSDCKFYDLNAKWIKEGKIHAVELFNEKEYYPECATWCIDHKLAPIAASDAHGPMETLYTPGVARPYTIVLAKENSQEAIREALFARRTIAIFNDQAAATTPLLNALFNASVRVEKLNNGNWSITNLSDLPFQINSEALNRTLMPDMTLQFAPPKDASKMDIEIKNLHVTANENLKTTIKPINK